ncbi:RNA polymerase sigma factor [Engelhardtia mirabilis]|uniref:ECF RNA polymerase sigma-E factor n=1 Tax=Engelhardtia mirabilis TaxID=2528011 RepID=A0A518BN45_9BACT|nr:ECF RNA polymerase sigma-E factor [Planctomycetes bacterium Pla133]QDV02720.1 ECF RNA polymerase sigma-E factor [Planctomycetes bacterium Pla86]
MDHDESLSVAEQQSLTATVQLLERYREGDDGALNRLFERYYERVRMVVRSKIGPSLRGRTDIDDLVQRTFLHALAGIESFEYRTEGAFMCWLSTIAINQIRGELDYLQAAKRDVRRDRAIESLGRQATSGSVRFDPAGDSTLPPEAAARAEASEIILVAMDGLSEQHREVLLLRDYLGLSWRDVAQELGRDSEGAATMLHARARIALSKAVRQRLSD